MANISYIKSALNHSSALTPAAVAVTQFGLWGSIKKGFKKYAKPIAAIVGVAASIAVPFIAPAVAGTIFSGTALASGAIGSAIAGAGMGAAAGALTAYGTGQNVLSGALTGGLVGGLGGGIAGYTSGGGFLAQAPATGPVNIVPGTQGYGQVMAGGVTPVPAAGTGSPTVQPASSTEVVTTGAAAGEATGQTIGSRLLDASLKAAPNAIGSIVTSIADGDVAAATKQMKAELDRLQSSDIDAYNKAKQVYDQLYARYQSMDPTAAAQLAEAGVQARTAAQIAQINPAAGSSAYSYAPSLEARRASILGGGLGQKAYTDAYYAGESTKNQALAGLQNFPKYSSSTGNYLSSQVSNAQNAQAGLGKDIGGFLTPYAQELAAYYNPDMTTKKSGRSDDRNIVIDVGSLFGDNR